MSLSKYAQRSIISLKLRFTLINGYGDNVGDSEGFMDGTSEELGVVDGPLLGKSDGISLGLLDGADDAKTDGDELGVILG